MTWSLARAGDLREELRLPAASAAADEARLLRLLEDVSAGIENWLGRSLRVVENAVTVVDGFGGRVLPIPDHAAVPAVACDLDRDGIYETSVPAADLRAVRFHTAVTGLVLLTGAPIAAWPTGEGAVQLTGTRGFGDEREPLGTLTAPLSASASTMTLPAGAGPGDTLVIDGERIYVRTSAGAVARGVRGTAAAAHPAGAAIEREVYPRALVRAALLQATRLHREGLEAYAAAGGGEFVGPVMSTTYPVVRDLLAPYRRTFAAVA
jgi:hypothetical protein